MSEESKEDTFWKGIIRKYWVAFLILALVVVGFFIVFFTIILAYVENSAIGGFGTWTLAEFSVGTGILWLLVLFGWELLLGVLPFGGLCLLILGIYWAVILSEEDKAAIKARDRKKKKYRKTEGGGFTFLITIAFLIVVFVDGQWLTPIGSPSLPYSYWIQAYLTGFIYVCLIAGIPILILFILYLVYKGKKTE
jgi:hypothetical protein